MLSIGYLTCVMVIGYEIDKFLLQRIFDSPCIKCMQILYMEFPIDNAPLIRVESLGLQLNPATSAFESSAKRVDESSGTLVRARRIRFILFPPIET